MGKKQAAPSNDAVSIGSALRAATASALRAAQSCEEDEASGTFAIPRDSATRTEQNGQKATARRCGGHGEPLVLLHGFALCTATWRPILPALKEHHQVFALAIPGHEGSDPLPEDYRHTIDSGVDLLERKLDAMQIDKAHVVGNSLGGWLAIELARRGRALSVVAMAPGGGWELGSREQQRIHRHFKLTRALLRVGGHAALRMVRWSLARQAFLRDCVARPHLLTPEDAKLLIDSAYRCAVYDDVLAALPMQAPAEPFHELPCPVRLLWGAEDRLLPIDGYSERWRRILPGAEWVVLPNVGHVQVYDDPEAVARAILQVTAQNQPAIRLAG